MRLSGGAPGVSMEKENPDLGRFTVTKQEADKGAYETPTLRDVAKRPPYMHDASANTLGQVAAFLRSLTGEVAAEVGSPPQLPR